MARSLPEDAGLSHKNVREHALRGHLPTDDEVIRRVASPKEPIEVLDMPADPLRVTPRTELLGHIAPNNNQSAGSVGKANDPPRVHGERNRGHFVRPRPKSNSTGEVCSV